MKLLPALAFACLLGRASAQPLSPADVAAPNMLSPGTTSAAAVPAVSTADAASLVQNSETLLDQRDGQDALADAEAAVQAGGGADAYAARAEARIALNRADEGLIDYAEAARRDPGRYQKKYEALKARLEPNGEKGKSAKSHTPGGIALIFVKLLAAAGVILLIVGLRLL